MRSADGDLRDWWRHERDGAAAALATGLGGWGMAMGMLGLGLGAWLGASGLGGHVIDAFDGTVESS